MYPYLLTFGRLQISSLGFFIIIAWGIFSFRFWRYLRDQGIEDDKIYDLMFYGTLTAVIFGRIFYVIYDYEIFSENLLAVLAFWVAPGISFIGAIICALIFMVIYAKYKKIRFAYIFDAFGHGIIVSSFAASIGIILSGSLSGKSGSLPWFDISLHPVSIYLFLVLFFLTFIQAFYFGKSISSKWVLSRYGFLSLMIFSLGMIIVEFFREQRQYFLGLSLPQWVYIAVFAESFGGYFVKSKGNIILYNKFVNLKEVFKLKGKSLYGNIGSVFYRKHQKEPVGGENKDNPEDQ